MWRRSRDVGGSSDGVLRKTELPKNNFDVGRAQFAVFDRRLSCADIDRPVAALAFSRLPIVTDTVLSASLLQYSQELTTLHSPTAVAPMLLLSVKKHRTNMRGIQ